MRRARVCLAPIRQPSDGRPHRSGKTERKAHIGRPGDARLLRAIAYCIEEQRRRPCAERDVGQGRMERVPQPCPMEEILDGASGRSKGIEGAPHSGLEHVGRRVEPLVDWRATASILEVPCVPPPLGRLPAPRRAVLVRMVRKGHAAGHPGEIQAWP